MGSTVSGREEEVGVTEPLGHPVHLILLSPHSTDGESEQLTQDHVENGKRNQDPDSGGKAQARFRTP